MEINLSKKISSYSQEVNNTVKKLQTIEKNGLAYTQQVSSEGEKTLFVYSMDQDFIYPDTEHNRTVLHLRIDDYLETLQRFADLHQQKLFTIRRVATTLALSGTCVFLSSQNTSSSLFFFTGAALAGAIYLKENHDGPMNHLKDVNWVLEHLDETNLFLNEEQKNGTLSKKLPLSSRLLAEESKINLSKENILIVPRRELKVLRKTMNYSQRKERNI